MTDYRSPHIPLVPTWAKLLVLGVVLAIGSALHETGSSGSRITSAVSSGQYEPTAYDRCVHDHGASWCDAHARCVAKYGKDICTEENYAKTTAALDKASHQLRAFARIQQVGKDLDGIRDDRLSGKISSADANRKMDRLDRELDDASAEFNRWK